MSLTDDYEDRENELVKEIAEWTLIAEKKYGEGYKDAMQKVRESWLKYKENWDNGNPLSPNELKELFGVNEE